MKTPTVENCKLENYSALLKGLPMTCSLASILGPDDNVVWESGTMPTEDRQSIYQQSQSEVIMDRVYTKSFQNGILYRVNLAGDQQGQKLGSLVCWNQNRQPQPLIAEVLHSIASCLKEELNLNDELDAMATELTVRYEELNLLYNTQDQVAFFKEGQEALHDLVKNCSDYLNLTAAFLILPDKEVMFQHSGDKKDHSRLLDIARSQLIPHISKTGESLVINGPNDEGYEWLDDCGYKVIATPVFSSADNVDGILTIAKDATSQDFHNSDRNLLEVISRKASKIINSNYDSLTGLMRRNGLEHLLKESLSECRLRSAQHCLLHINVDQMHVVNDSFGHFAGDRVLREISTVLRSVLRSNDIIARLGGDDFGVLVRHCNLKQGVNLAEKIRSGISKLKSIVDDEELNITASIGISLVTAQSDNIKDILASAEVAVSAAKESGRDQVTVYDKRNRDLVRRQEQIHWVARIQAALKEDKFRLYAQTILPLNDTSDYRHCEILLRLQESEKIVAPGAFMSAAERYDLMSTIDRWVITKSFEVLSQSGLASEKSVFAINLSGQSMGDTELVDFVSKKLGESGLNPASVCFEITETSAISNIANAHRFICEMRQLGCRFALDDFGSGLSSFGYLKQLDVDYLKIDGQFVKNMANDEVDRSMVEAIHKVGRVLGLKTVAEFVENQAIVDALREIGVDLAQGYGIQKPIPLDAHLDSLRVELKKASNQ